MLRLNQLLAHHGIQRKDLAAEIQRLNPKNHVGLSRTSISDLVNHGVYPKTRQRGDVQRTIRSALISLGVNEVDAASAFKKVAGRPERMGVPRNEAPPERNASTHQTTRGAYMLIRKTALSAQAIDYFQLAGDPFKPPQTREEVFMSRVQRVSYEQMKNNAYYGGFLVMVGESGAGKSTLKDLLIDELNEKAEVVVEPMVIGMDENDTKGTTLKASHIAGAILREVAPQERPKRTLEERDRQILMALTRDAQENDKRRYLLVIEEAHRLPVATLKHLKNFFELRAGRRHLLSILLLGQPELKRRLSPFDHDIREVWQRSQVETLEPLGKHLPEYVKFRLGAAAAVFRADAFEGLTAQLTDRINKRSCVYPLAVDNWIAATMNVAAKVGAKQITAETIDSTRAMLDREYRGI